MSELLRHLLGRVRRLDVSLMLVGLAVVLGAWGFIAITDEVLEGDTRAFDERVLRALRRADDAALPIGPDWLHGLARDITALGGAAVLTLLILLVAAYLMLQARRRAMWLVLASSGGGLLLSLLLKGGIGRARPRIVPHLVDVATSSFPSGHSMLSAAVYLTLAALLASIETRRRVQAYLVAGGLLVTLLVGLSRVYLGVHYPTDVLAGWTAGLVWAVLCWLVAERVRLRGEAISLDAQGPAGHAPAPRPHAGPVRTALRPAGLHRGPLGEPRGCSAADALSPGPHRAPGPGRPAAPRRGQ